LEIGFRERGFGFKRGVESRETSEVYSEGEREVGKKGNGSFFWLKRYSGGSLWLGKR